MSDGPEFSVRRDLVPKDPEPPPAEAMVSMIAAELKAEVERRDEYYGLDNWSFEEVVRFVLVRSAG